MPHHKSCVKRVKTNAVARSRNRASKSRLNTAMRRIYSAQTREEVEQLFPETVSLIDRLRSKRVLHKKNAANKKSRLSHFVSNFQSS